MQLLSKHLLFALLFSALPIALFAQNGIDSSPKVAASAEEVCPLKVGASVPKLRLTSVQGQEVDLIAEVAKKPTILLFYRGSWCVYCNAQMGKLKEIETGLLDLGYQLIAISPDRPEKLRETLDKYEFRYTLLSDSKMDAAQAFGLAFRVSEKTLQRYKTINIDLEGASGESHHLLPVPAVFVVGTEGVIKYSYVNPNYKVRLDPEVLLAAARSALK